MTVQVSVTAKETETVQSTEGIELDAKIEKSVNKQSKEDKKEHKQVQKAKKRYIKNVSSIQNMNEKKRIKERNLEFYNSRLQIQKSKLEKLEKKKGEIQ